MHQKHFERCSSLQCTSTVTPLAAEGRRVCESITCLSASTFLSHSSEAFSSSYTASPWPTSSAFFVPSEEPNQLLSSYQSPAMYLAVRRLGNAAWKASLSQSQVTLHSVTFSFRSGRCSHSSSLFLILTFYILYSRLPSLIGCSFHRQLSLPFPAWRWASLVSTSWIHHTDS